ncbi:hypothetical protein [Yimella sp. cx-51]|uniref:hypothetical protein n=1 Tax=Yimella sp. cx-51 TaxID=2770551 RepID=UPI00165D914E|nr:hypothetical protein [Yimella sp. cx-51]MBC9955555.1 hypothetical protein [Yimella sp. cx-51]QTH37866.1 hypothetical protein J5M86_13620 [Yimella sp. cx-51]
MTRTSDRAPEPMLVAVLLTAGAAVAAVALGAGLAVGVLIVTLAPWTSVLGYELYAHRHMERYVS